MEWLRKLLGLAPKVDLAEIIRNGATIIDVRTPGEYATGHIDGSINIPLDKISKSVDKLKKKQPIITCCASGARSGAAKRLLESAGIQEVYNGGSWYSVAKYFR